jgi:predicted esterase
VEFGRDARRRLESAGLDVEYHEHGGGHHIDPRTVPLMTRWVGERVAHSPI